MNWLDAVRILLDVILVILASVWYVQYTDDKRKASESQVELLRLRRITDEREFEKELNKIVGRRRRPGRNG